MNAIIERIKGEPVLFYTFVAALINTALAFGLALTGDQVAQLNILVLAILSVIVRSKVTPA